MKTLILSCTTGEGHNSCARAIKEYYDLRGEACTVADSLSFVSEEVSKLIAKGHLFIYRKLSPLFEWGYELAEHHPEKFDEDSRLYHFFARGAEDLYQYILRQNFDCILCTHPFSAMMLTAVRRRYDLMAVTGFVATDYTCCPGVNCSDLDLYFIPDETLTEEFCAQGIRREKIRPSGIPIRQAFFSALPQENAKEAVGIVPDHAHLVLACGSMGCGPMEELSEVLAPSLDEKTDLTIVCGTNEKLLEAMVERHRNRSNVHVKSFVRDMPLLLESADLYITKPGGLSITEAMARNVPMVLVNAVGGCENYNLEHLLDQGRAGTGETVEELAKACITMLRNPPKPTEVWRPQQNAAPIIYETMKQRYEIHEKTALSRT